MRVWRSETVHRLTTPLNSHFLPMMIDDLLAGVNQVVFVHDIIAIKHGTGLVAGNAHGDFLWDPGSHKIANAGAAEIMNQGSAIAPFANVLPGRILPVSQPDLDAGALPCSFD